MSLIFTKRIKNMGIAMAKRIINGESYRSVAEDYEMSCAQVRTRVEHVIWARIDNAPKIPGDPNPVMCISWIRRNRDWWLKRLEEPEDGEVGDE